MSYFLEDIDIPELRQLPGLATAAQVAVILKCSKRHILNECNAGRMAFVNIAGRFLITPDSIKNYIQRKIQPCQNVTKEPISSGSKRVIVGTSIGTREDANARNQRALAIVSKLTKNSPSTTSR